MFKDKQPHKGALANINTGESQYATVTEHNAFKVGNVSKANVAQGRFYDFHRSVLIIYE